LKPGFERRKNPAEKEKEKRGPISIPIREKREKKNLKRKGDSGTKKGRGLLLPWQKKRGEVIKEKEEKRENKSPSSLSKRLVHSTGSLEKRKKEEKESSSHSPPILSVEKEKEAVIPNGKKRKCSASHNF